MLQDVIIDMRTIQKCEGGEGVDGLNFTTDGYYTYDDNVGCLTYLESQVTGMEGTRTSVFVMPDSVVVDRDGKITSRMIFREGEKNRFLYNTPFGNATMGLNTRSIKQNMGADGGHLEIEYVLDVEHTVFTKNKFIIDVRKSGARTNA